MRTNTHTPTTSAPAAFASFLVAVVVDFGISALAFFGLIFAVCEIRVVTRHNDCVVTQRRDVAEGLTLPRERNSS